MELVLIVGTEKPRTLHFGTRHSAKVSKFSLTKISGNEWKNVAKLPNIHVAKFRDHPIQHTFVFLLYNM